MDSTGRLFSNPMTGHVVTFLQTAEETGGELLWLDYVVTRPERVAVWLRLATIRTGATGR